MATSADRGSCRGGRDSERAAVGDMSVLVTIWSVAVLAESRIVVEPGDVDLGEGQGSPKRLAIRSALLASMGSPLYPFSVATPLKMRCHRPGSQCSKEEAPPSTVPLLPLGRALARAPRVRCEWKASRMPHTAELPPFPSP